MNIYKMVTDQILASLKQGEIPWVRPWNVEQPRNLISKKAYKGVNLWLLMGKGGSPYWLTYKQAKQLGGNVRKGEHGSMVIYWSMLKTKDKDNKEKTVPLLRYFTVFNATQCDGIDCPKGEEKREIKEASAIVDGMPRKPQIKHDDINRAFYSPMGDFVNMPPINQFKDSASYHAVLFHELAHATGHSTRLSRNTLTGQTNFGSADYGKEELTAELCSSFLCHKAGLNKDIKDHASYIQGWIKSLKDEPNLIIWASGRAEAACKYILNENQLTGDES
jgi:antirestriction protein ArdC